MQGPSPGTGAFCYSGTQHVEDGRGVVKAVVTGLPGELLRRCPFLGWALCGGWGRADPR